jgi:hypothetical protein
MHLRRQHLNRAVLGPEPEEGIGTSKGRRTGGRRRLHIRDIYIFM